MDRLFAALILFTRLPVWRVVNVSQKSYDSAVVFWPLVGWLTGGLAGLLIWLLPTEWSMTMTVTLALMARLLLTGALHEDGLADFCDAFGCGGDKQRILAIMKDSHIGTYGVIGLILYFILAVSILSSMSKMEAALAIFACDPFAKLCASQLTNFLAYARPEGAKNKIAYRRMSIEQILWQVVFGAAPLLLFVRYFGVDCGMAAVAPVVAAILLMMYMHRKIGGYTGDCCGATYLICELAMMLALYWIAS